MNEDAAEGYSRTVGAYLDHGIPVNAHGRYGTAANAAGVGGSVEVLELLRSRGADLNATDSSGKSPLSDAIDMKRTEAIAYLRAHGAREIEPLPPPPINADVTVRP
jgi:ankyrin repeat protein